jgi:hypothetical protein
VRCHITDSNKIHHTAILNIKFMNPLLTNNLRLCKRPNAIIARQPIPEDHNFHLPFAPTASLRDPIRSTSIPLSPWLDYHSTLKTEALRSSETSANLY